MTHNRKKDPQVRYDTHPLLGYSLLPLARVARTEADHFEPLSEPHKLPDFTNTPSENDSPKEEKFGACIVGDKK